MTQPLTTMQAPVFAGRTRMGGLSYIERPGPGPVVFFLHGIGSNAHSFAPASQFLPADLHLIAWNAPGYLDSQPLANPWPVAADYAGAAAGLVESLGLAEVHLVGHSLGTLIAVALAELAPKRVASLTLAAAANGYGVPRGARLPPTAAARLEDLAREGPTAFARARAPRLVFDPDANESVVALVEAEMARINPDGYGQAVHMLASGDLAGAMARLSCCPSFIIGSEDRVTPLEQTTTAADAWASAHGTKPGVTVIPKAGHAVHIQAPAQFARALLELVPALNGQVSPSGKGDPHGG